MTRKAVLGPLLVCCLTPTWAEEACPWLNSATAGGFLGGAATSKVTHPGRDKADATCEFVHQSKPDLTLRIEVETMANIQEEFKSFLARCQSGTTPVRGIGNTAVACSSKQNAQTCEQIVGRVRERAFVVQLCTGGNPAEVASKARDAADEVAGNLF